MKDNLVNLIFSNQDGTVKEITNVKMFNIEDNSFVFQTTERTEEFKYKHISKNKIELINEFFHDEETHLKVDHIIGEYNG